MTQATPGPDQLPEPEEPLDEGLIAGRPVEDRSFEMVETAVGVALGVAAGIAAGTFLAGAPGTVVGGIVGGIVGGAIGLGVGEALEEAEGEVARTTDATVPHPRPQH
jgi:phage tail tape-measure protein